MVTSPKGGNIQVRLRNPERTVAVEGATTVGRLLTELEIHPDSVIVIRGDSLLTRDEQLSPDDEIELRPVVSGGSG